MGPCGDSRSVLATVSPARAARFLRSAAPRPGVAPMKDWPKQWSRLSEPGSFELWMGRAYFCLARMQRPRADATLRIEPLSGEAKPRECLELPFKAPARVA